MVVAVADEEVVDGKSEVGGFPVERRPMRQWMLRITAYAQRLIDELDGLDWPESIKLLQRIVNIGGLIDRDSSVWVSYVLLGGVFVVVGLFLFTKRSPEEAPE